MKEQSEQNVKVLRHNSLSSCRHYWVFHFHGSVFIPITEPNSYLCPDYYGKNTDGGRLMWKIIMSYTEIFLKARFIV